MAGFGLVDPRYAFDLSFKDPTVKSFTQKKDAFSLTFHDPTTAGQANGIGMAMPPVAPGTIPGAGVAPVPPIGAGAVNQGNPQQPDFLQKLWTGLNDPANRAGIARMLAMVGGSLSAVEPNSWQNQLATGVQSTAAGVQQQQALAGKDMSGIAGFGMSPAERMEVTKQLQEQQLATQKMDLEKQKVGLMAQSTASDITRNEAMNKLSSAQAAGIPTAEQEQKNKLEQLYTQGMIDEKLRKMPIKYESHSWNERGEALPSVYDLLRGEYIIYDEKSLDKFAKSITPANPSGDRSTLERIPVPPKIDEKERTSIINYRFEEIRNKLPKEHFGMDSIEAEDLPSYMDKINASTTIPIQVKAKARYIIALQQGLDIDAQGNPELARAWAEISKDAGEYTPSKKPSFFGTK
jgi:hypothetical protein